MSLVLLCTCACTRGWGAFEVWYGSYVLCIVVRYESDFFAVNGYALFWGIVNAHSKIVIRTSLTRTSDSSPRSTHSLYSVYLGPSTDSLLLLL
jgi:hypothetical protein